jgi:hypothetical protein
MPLFAFCTTEKRLSQYFDYWIHSCSVTCSSKQSTLLVKQTVHGIALIDCNECAHAVNNSYQFYLSVDFINTAGSFSTVQTKNVNLY